MILITKDPCPEELTKYAKLKGACYDLIPQEVKQSIRTALLHEQGGLCAYCMGRISDDALKIEHFVSRHHYPQMGLSYDNLLACCTGGEKKGKERHCDSAKGSTSITCSPLNEQCINSLSYDLDDGSIHSSHAPWEQELNDVLQLNIPKLKQMRKAALDGFLYTWAAGEDEEDYVAKILARDEEGKLLPYCGIIQYFCARRQSRKK